MADHPMGESAGMPPVGSMTQAGALAHMITYHDPRPPMAGAGTDLNAIHRQAHREGRVSHPHGHQGTGWEMADLSQAARAVLAADASPPRTLPPDALEVGLHARVTAGFHSGRQGHVTAVRASSVVIEDAWGEQFTVLRRDVVTTGKPRSDGPHEISRAQTQEEVRLSRLPTTMLPGEMLAHLAQLHHAHPSAADQRGGLDGYHSQMHRQGRVAVSHSHRAPEAGRSRVLLASGQDVTDLYNATAAVRPDTEPVRLMADEW